MTETELKACWKHCTRNRAEVLNSSLCGCFYCGKIYPPMLIAEWVDREGQTALCPNCSIDSVIGDASGIELTLEFLNEMHVRYFSGERHKSRLIP